MSEVTSSKGVETASSVSGHVKIPWDLVEALLTVLFAWLKNKQSSSTSS